MNRINKLKKLLLLSILIILLTMSKVFSAEKDSIKLDYNKIYSLCLDGNVTPALEIIRAADYKKLNDKDKIFKDNFESRFSKETDESDYLKSKESSISDIIKIFHNYWRKSLLDNSNNYDKELISNLALFLKSDENEDSVKVNLDNYLKSLGLYTAGFGKTGRFLDLLVWSSENDTVYSIPLHKEVLKVKVVFMENFLTLGWQEFATLARYYPGGWTTTESLFCVKSAYDLNSESFKISYLAHEGRHFSDYKIFPKLKSEDLEYRAKLTELSLANESLFNTISFFINNSNYEGNNGHSVANYCVVRDLSKKLFNEDFEKDIEKWKTVKISVINAAAYNILTKNTKILKKLGPDVEKYIKN